MHVTAILTRAAEEGFTAFNPETGTTIEGKTIDDALADLREAVGLYLDEFPLRMSDAPLITALDIGVDA